MSILIIEIEQDNPISNFEILYETQISFIVKSRIVTFVANHFRYFAHVLQKVDAVRITIWSLNMHIIICRQPVNGVWLVTKIWDMDLLSPQLRQILICDARSFSHFEEIVNYLKLIECPCCNCFDFKYAIFWSSHPSVSPMFWTD